MSDDDATSAVDDGASVATQLLRVPILVPFALNPAHAMQGVINFAKSDNVKLHKKGTSRLSEDPFDCVPEDLHQFLKTLGDRATEYQWNDDVFGILQIPDHLNNPTKYTNLLTNHGELDLEDILNFEKSYINSPTRAAQDTNMLYHCLIGSLSKAGKTKVMVWEDQYKINGRPSGNLLLKIIIRESHLDSNATTTSIRNQLSSLDIFITTVGCDITKFNAHVRLLLEGLASRGQTTHDLLSNLFKGYTAASDNTFTKYIERKQEEYEDGTDIQPIALMSLADNKYKTLKVKGTWNAPSQEEEKILALKTEIDNLKRFRKETPSAPPGTPRKQPAGRKDKPEWLLKNKAPSDVNETRQFDNHAWYYCCEQLGGKCNGKWRQHKPSECKGRAFVPEYKRKNTTADSKKEKRLKLTKAMQSLLEEVNQEDSDENSQE